MNRSWTSHLTSLSLALSIGKISEHCCETKRRDVKSTWQTMKHWTNKWYYHSLISQVSDIMLTNKVIVISFCIHWSMSYFSQLDSCGIIGAKTYTKRKSLNLSFQNLMTWYYAVSGAPHCLLGLRRLWRGADCSESLASGLSSLSCTICYRFKSIKYRWAQSQYITQLGINLKWLITPAGSLWLSHKTFFSV